MLINENTQEVVCKIAREYLGMTKEEFDQAIIDNGEVAANEWHKRKDNNDYYVNTNTNIIGLAGFNSVDRIDNILFPLRSYHFRSVLDYGAGIGVLAQLLTINSDNVYYYDLPSKTQSFAKHLCSKTKNDIIFLNEEDVFTRKYDLIVCMDVFEHLEDPITLLRTMIDSIPSGGRILTSGLFFSTTQPMHLASNVEKVDEFNDILFSLCHPEYFYSTSRETIMLMVKK